LRPAFQPRFADLPAVFPVFPLPGAVVLPGGRLPLNIFEPRYLAMVEDALGAGRMFGMIQPDPSGAAGPSGPALYRVGCLGRLTAFGETEDGRFLVTLDGLIRFAVAEELEMRRGYRRVRADFALFAEDLESGAGSVGVEREELLGTLRRYFTARGLQANWEAMTEMDTATLVVTLAAACPFEVAEKQALLEAPTPADRAEALLALLRIAAHQGGDDKPGRLVS
jgi:uncharacterized protein